MEQSRNCGVVICQPMGHEYIYCHRALRQLANRLAEVGFPVLRFDFYGSGDSYGDLEDAELSQWQRDVSSAIAELQFRTSVTRICLIGVRLGASLSLIAAAQEDGIDSLVLWDPIVRGESYLEELRLLQKEALRRRPKSSLRKATEDEVIGFPLSNVLRAEIHRLNLLAVEVKRETKILTVQSDHSANYDPLRDHLLQHGIQFHHQQIQAPKVWLPTVDGSLLVPSQILRSVVSWTSSVQA